MADNPNEGQNTPTPQNPVVEYLDLGEGNKLTKDQALALKSKADGLEKGTIDLFGVAEEWKQKAINFETQLNEYGNAKIQAELARDSATAKVKEMEGQITNYISPEKYSELKTQHDLLMLAQVQSRMEKINKETGIPMENLHGKTIEQLETLEETSKFMFQNNSKIDKDSGFGNSAVAPTSAVEQLEANKRQLEKFKGGKK
ncbi:MAG: hypothetical protein GF393_12800 [Armatimonadia bacterium]|nr:hypothetical protein [Armatimonadia bacterium]